MANIHKLISISTEQKRNKKEMIKNGNANIVKNNWNNIGNNGNRKNDKLVDE
ncbi:hypothetical protein KKA09_01920 [Patescibacteria group bacterium]|nr:hypothetical protein [Patescibacteria group bacterium]